MEVLQTRKLPIRKLQKKIIIIGEGGVGKTTLLYRYVNKKFLSNTKMTIGSDFFVKKVKLIKDEQENRITFMIWDFAGQKRFRLMLKDFARGAQAVILAFDLFRIQTLVKLQNWIELMEEAGLWGNPKVEFFLVGTKKDLMAKLRADAIPEEKIQEFQKNYHIKKFKKTSAAEDEGINEFFIDISLSLIEQENRKKL
jgi:small GTP-binding protein